MLISSPPFKSYITHILQWEGGLSNDPNDTAVHCAPFPGAYHTNKGVTYCTFLANADTLGLVKDYYTFIRLKDDDIGRFAYLFYLKSQGNRIPDPTSLALTEAAWGSGQERAVIHLQRALNHLGQNLIEDGVIGPKTIAAANVVNPEQLYSAYWAERKAFIKYLGSLPKYSKWINGWENRIASFLEKFPMGPAMGGIFILAIGLFLAIHKDL